VLPAQFPQLLVNGSEGIAVGMATRIPPHNLRSIIDACVLLIDDENVSLTRLANKVKAPDFPTGGRILNNSKELREIYETGRGTVRTQCTWETEKEGRKNYIIVTTIPYGVNKATIVEKIGALIAERKVPQLVDVRDESTDEVRVVLEMKKSGLEGPAMAYLLKHTPLQTSFHVNLTCLIPTPNGGPCRPERVNLRAMLWHWSRFRHETVRRRFEYDLQKLRERIHLLEGFAKVFDALDEAIRIIRASEGKRDAAEQLMFRFDLDDVQTEAVLELKLYKLAKMEIQAIMDELSNKRAEAALIEALLASDEALWDVVKEELLELRKLYGEPRRTLLGIDEDETVVYSEADYIVSENAYVIVTRDGWIKRQLSFTDLEKIRTREGDSIGWVARANSRSTISFFGSQGAAFVMRIADIPSTTGYGEPIQRHFNFADGERIAGVIVHDPRALPKEIASDEIPVDTQDDGDPIEPPPHAVAVTRKGRCVRFALTTHNEVSNKNGRRYMRPNGDDDAVVAVYQCDTTEHMSIASEEGRALCFPVTQVKYVRGAGKGVIAIKLKDGDRVLAFELTRQKFQGAIVRTPQGREETVRPSKFLGNRAARGSVVIKRGRFAHWEIPVMRYDLLHDTTEDEEPPEDGEDPGGGGGTSNGGSGSELSQPENQQQGLLLPFGSGGDA
jgi:DNA gyrase subunit A